MRPYAFIAPLALAAALAGSAVAQTPQVTVRVGGDLTEEVRGLGQRDVDQQVARLQSVLERRLASDEALAGARINLVLTDLKPNRPTFTQANDRPGLSMIHSRSIGGAAIEGEIVTADGQRLPVRYSNYSTSIQEVRGHTTWQDAENTYSRLASRILAGRPVYR